VAMLQLAVANASEIKQSQRSLFAKCTGIWETYKWK